MSPLFPRKWKYLKEIWTWPHINSYNLMGFWVEYATENKIKRILLKLYGIFTSTCCIALILNILIGVALKLANHNVIDSMLDILMGALIILSGLQMYLARRHRERFKHAMNLIDDLNNDIKGPDEIFILRKTILRAWILYFGSVIMTICGMAHWYIRPIIYIILYNEKTMILLNWPNLTDTWQKFIIGYIYQLLALSYAGFFYLIFYCMFFCISEFIICHFSIEEIKLKKLKLKRTSEETLQLKKIVQVHSKLFEICNDLKVGTNAVLIAQATLTVFTYCMALYMFTMSDHNFNFMVSLLEGVTEASAFLFLSCWYCSELTKRCEDFISAAYMSGWIDGSISQKRILLNIMTRGMSPVTFGGFLKVNLNTFVNILKTAFSFFNFLLAILGNYRN